MNCDWSVFSVKQKDGCVIGAPIFLFWNFVCETVQRNYGWYVTLTSIESSEKVRAEEPATSITRMRKFVFVKLLRLHVRPQVSVGVPRIYVALVVVNVGVDLAVVHVVPPFQEIWTQILGALVVLLTFALSLTSIPLTAVRLDMLKL